MISWINLRLSDCQTAEQPGQLFGDLGVQTLRKFSKLNDELLEFFKMNIWLKNPNESILADPKMVLWKTHQFCPTAKGWRSWLVGAWISDVGNAIGWLNFEAYGWWLKSCTSWYGKYPIICRVLYIPGGAGCLPSTVCPIFINFAGQHSIILSQGHSTSFDHKIMQAWPARGKLWGSGIWSVSKDQFQTAWKTENLSAQNLPDLKACLWTVLAI